MRLFFIVALGLLLPSRASAQSIDLARVRDSATRGFALVQATQKASLTKQACAFTCHLQTMSALAYHSMKEHGLPVDDAIARADAVKAFSLLASDVSAAVEENSFGEVWANSFALVAAHTIGLRPSLATAARARAFALRQEPAGDWIGVHVRAPSSYSSFTFTAWGLRVLQLYGHRTQDTDVNARVAKARTWLASHQPHSTEDRTFQLLGLLWAGGEPDALKRMGQALAAAQQADGGWNSLAGRASDAYSTGQALVALHDAAGMSTSNRVWRRGVAFLLNTQAADGSWRVASRLPVTLDVSPPYFESGYPYGHDQFISVAGAGWAVMALTRTLGPARAAERLPLAAVEPPAVESWVETVIFGSVNDLRDLLDNGLDPNAATALGGTTVLMLVLPDLDKARLLLERGANVNVRSRQRQYSALMIAAQYRDGKAAIRLLLDRGAALAGAGDRRPFNAGSALFFATLADNAEAIPFLRQSAGAINQSSVFEMTPLAAAIIFDLFDSARALVALGADVELPDVSGYTPLMQAVLGNRIEGARMLIAYGADVNKVNSRGMTPLMIAASIDFGDAAIVNLLLQAGARADARDKDGLTALALAEKYRHTHLLPSLRAAKAER